MASPSPLLSIQDLTVSFRTEAGVVQAVDRVSFDIFPGETLAVVGESGSGKSVSAMTILGLTESQGGVVEGGTVLFEGRDLRHASDSELRKLRGNRIAMIFQEPMSSLNPVFTLGDQIGETLVLHQGLTQQQAHRAAIELLDLVGIPAPELRVNEYPHQLSGGMRQRVAIAMALGCRPSLLIADEPTTALDVTVQAQILELLEQLQKEMGMSILMITHDLGVVAEVAHRAVVMYAGRIVEEAPVEQLFSRPQHPYTAGLMRSIPNLNDGPNVPLRPIEGNVPDALHFPAGCRFHPRCAYAFKPCTSKRPALETIKASGGQNTAQRSACFHTEANPEVDYRLDDFLKDNPDSPAPKGSPA